MAQADLISVIIGIDLLVISPVSMAKSWKNQQYLPCITAVDDDIQAKTDNIYSWVIYYSLARVVKDVLEGAVGQTAQDL